MAPADSKPQQLLGSERDESRGMVLEPSNRLPAMPLGPWHSAGQPVTPAPNPQRTKNANTLGPNEHTLPTPLHFFLP